MTAEELPETAPRPTFVVAAGLFLRLLGVVYALAFGSLATQVRGLIGAGGILPARDFLSAVHDALGPRAWWAVPTVFWAGCSDGAIQAVCWLATGAGCLVALGIAQAPLLIVEWALFLSLCSVGQAFLGFQWDALLLEAGFIAIWLAPWRGLTRWRALPLPRAIPLWLLRLLLLKLMVSSGCVKLTSGDPTWRSLTALDHHFETQPLPTWIGYFAHQAPAWAHRVWTLSTFVIELGLPFGVFLPRPGRIVSFVGLAFLQVLIGATGNYCYFNLLALALCLLLLDDACFPRRWRVTGTARGGRPFLRRAGLIVSGAFAALWGLVGVGQVGLAAGSPWTVGPASIGLPEFPRLLGEKIASLRTINSYGLFAVMTTERDEIAIEGSNDGEAWREYSFRWKPGDPTRRPAFVEPMQPRLDWQMWFAALGGWRHAEWMVNLLRRLLEGSPDVLALFEANPFPEGPPRRVRLRFEQYHFTTVARLRGTGDWWDVGPPTYSSELTLHSFVGR